MANSNTGFGKVKLFDDFLGKAVDETNIINVATTSGGTEAITVQNNGACRLTTQATTANNARISFGLQWNPSHGSCIMETRVAQITALTARAFFIGWTDDATTDEAPISLATATFTYTADNAVGFVFNTAATDGTYYYACGSKATAGQAAVTTCTLPAAVNTWQTFRVAIDADGDAVLSVDGKEVYRMANAITANTDITPTVCARANASTAVVMDVDYLYAEGGRE